MSSEGSLSSYEVVDVVKEDGPKYQGEASYYPSQIPEDSTHRVLSSAEEKLLSAHKPTECTSGEVTTIDAPKVEELAEKLMVATRENERYRKAMEECNRTLSKEVETSQNRKQEIDSLMAKYMAKVAELEDSNRSLQDQLSAVMSQKQEQQQGMSKLTDETDYSAQDASAAMRVAENNVEIEELKRRNNDLQQAQSSLQYQHDQLGQEYQRLLEENRNQSQYSSGNVQLEGRISELQQEMERMSLSSQSTVSELEDERRRLKSTIRSKEEEIDKLEKDLFAQRNKSIPNNPAERMAQKNLLLKKLEELNNENGRLKKDISDSVSLREDKEQLQKENSRLQEELDREISEHQERVRHHSISEQEKSTLQKLHSKVSEELENTKVDLMNHTEQLTTKEQRLQTKEQEIAELRKKLETLEMSNTQLNEQLNATSRNLDQALDSLRHHRQESETISSRASETQLQLQQERDQLNHQLQESAVNRDKLQQEKDQLSHQLQESAVERDKLLEQLREAYSEKGNIEQKFNEHEGNAKEMISQLQNRVQEKDAIIMDLDAKLKSSNQQLSETISEYQTTVQDLETTVQRKKALEGEMQKLRGHYTQVNDERNLLKRTVDEKDGEIQELMNARDKMIQEHSDTMELMRNQLQQYVRDYEEERVAREKFAQQMMKLKTTIKDKDDEIDSLQDQLTSYGGNKLKPAPDLTGAMGAGNTFDHKNAPLMESGEFSQREFSQRGDRWSGNKKQHAPSVSSQTSDEFSTYQPQTTPTRTNQQQQPVTMAHPPRPDPSLATANNRMFGAYGNPPPNDAAGTAGINSGLPPPDLSNNVKGSSYTDVHQLRQQPMNAPMGGNNPYGQDHQLNRPGEFRSENTSEYGDFNARNEVLPPVDLTSGRGPRPNTEVQQPLHQQPPINNFATISGGPGGPLEPCPLCGKRFPTIDELSRHASSCNY